MYGKQKQGASYGYTHVLGYHPLLASRSDTGEVLHARMRKGAANTQRGAKRFVDELIARACRCGATGEIVMRADSGFWSKNTIASLRCHAPTSTRALDGGFLSFGVDECSACIFAFVILHPVDRTLAGQRTSWGATEKTRP